MKLCFPGIHPSIPLLIHPSLYESFNTIGRQRLYYDVIDPYIFTGWGCFGEIPPSTEKLARTDLDRLVRAALWSSRLYLMTASCVQ